jgi:hypothetical protein
MDACHPLWLGQRHVGGDAGAEVAAVRPVALVTEALGEPMPQVCHEGAVHAGLPRTVRERVPGQGRHDQVEPVAEPVHEVQLLEETAGPPMRENQCFADACGLLVYKVDSRSVNLGDVVLVPVEALLLYPPVKTVRPVLEQITQVVQVGPLTPALAGRRVGPPCAPDTAPEVIQDRVGNRDHVRFDPHALIMPHVSKGISIRKRDTSMNASDVLMRYFDMWNTGDTTIADQILHPDWVDHAHPEVTGPAGVQRAVQTVRAARPGLHFSVHTVLGDKDLIAVFGSVGQPQPPTGSPGQLIWLIRLTDGLMAEMWTYQQNQPSR